MSEENMAAGDAVAEVRKNENVLDKAGEAHSEIRDTTPVPKPVAPVVERTDTNIPRFDGMRCSTCREIKQDEQLMKQPLDYKKNDDGTVSATIARYSIFCGTCQKFLGVYDPVASNELKDMINTRNEIEAKKSR